MISTDKIDDFLDSKSLKDIMIIYLMVILLCGYVCFYFLLPYAKTFKNTRLDIYAQKKSQLQTLRAMTDAINIKTVFLKKHIKNLIVEKNKLQLQNDYYNKLSDMLKVIEFNRQQCDKYVKSLISNAKKEDLKILSFNSKIFNENKNIINKKAEINLTLKGEYKNLLRFIYLCENMKNLLRIENMSINKNKIFKIKFVLYGFEK